MAEETVELMFDGKLMACTVETDKHGDIICRNENGEFIKFPKGVKLANAAKAHNKANSNPAAEE